jgi:hypothetical protein
MIRIELGAEIDGPKPTDGKRHGVFEYHAPAYPLVRGYARQPLLDACRQIKRMGGDTAERAGLFWPGSDVPSLTCSIEAGAGLTVEEGSKSNGPRFARFKPFPVRELREAADLKVIEHVA